MHHQAPTSMPVTHKHHCDAQEELQQIIPIVIGCFQVECCEFDVPAVDLPIFSSGSD